MNTSHRLVTAALAGLLLTAGWAAAGLRQDLALLGRMRQGRETMLAQVDARGAELLARYAAPADRAAIHYELAHIHAQTGMAVPARVIRHAREALAGPLPPERRATLHVYWGDAVRMADRRGRSAATRRKAAVAYLAGLREVLAVRLPDERPEELVETLFNTGDVEEDQRKQEEQARRSQEREFRRVMLNHREVLTRQITSMYERPPAGERELADLVKGALGDDAWSGRLLGRVPSDPTIQRPEGLGPGGWSVVAGGAGVLVILVLLGRRGARRSAPLPFG